MDAGPGPCLSLRTPVMALARLEDNSKYPGGALSV